jgi:hypothetical protein
VWTSYVCVESADDAATKVKQAGGSVLAEPSDVGDAGRVVVVADRSGATFGIWQPKGRKGVELVNEAGSWNSSSLNTPDLRGAQDFYGGRRLDVAVHHAPGHVDHPVLRYGRPGVQIGLDPEVLVRAAVGYLDHQHRPRWWSRR